MGSGSVESDICLCNRFFSVSTPLFCGQKKMETLLLPPFYSISERGMGLIEFQTFLDGFNLLDCSS